uniref:Capsid protein n=3 Tax=Sapporo virus TaxID=95342 RepID=G5EKV5_9CALI
MEGLGQPPQKGLNSPVEQKTQVVTPQDTISPTEALLLPTQVEMPNAGAQRLEMAAATGAMTSNVPMCVRECFAAVTTIPWNTRQAANTFLGAVHLGPRLNPYTAHLSAMYAGWGGSFQIRVTLSGSGIYAGRAVCAVLPPGVNPANVQNPGVFPHAFIDARTVDPVLINLPDIRATDFHRVDGDEATATVGLWVAQPLINPFNTGSAVSTCWLSFETRPGPDFDFCLLKAPDQEMDNGVSPAGLLPRRLGRSRGNRLGGRIVKLVVVAAAHQVNHHFAANSTTLGWSSMPLEPVAGHVTWYTTTTSEKRYGLLSAESKGIIFPNIVNHWPDTAMSTVTSINSSIPTSAFDNYVGSAGPVVTFQDNGDVDEANGQNGLFTAANVNFTSLSDSFDAASTYIYLPWMSRTPTDRNVYIKPTWINGSTSRPIREKCTNMRGTNYHFGGTGMANIVLWQEQDFTSWPGAAEVYCSQLESTAEMFQNNIVNIPTNQMAVFNVETNGNTFQIGILPNGYHVTTAPVGTVVELDPETGFRFVGLFPQSTSLQGPHGNNGRAVRFLE